MSWLGPVLRQVRVVQGTLLLVLSPLVACIAGAEPAPSAVAEQARAESLRPPAQPAGDPRLRSALQTLPRAARSRSMKGLQRVTTAAGPIKVNLEGRFQHASVAVVDAQGGLHATCVEGASETSTTE